MSSDEEEITPRAHKRRFNSIESSESESETFNNINGSTDQQRSSKRIRKRQSREFTMPSREKVWKEISDDTSPWKTVSDLKPRKRVNNFMKITNSYNKDVYTSDEDDSDENFINDNEEEEESEEDNSHRKRSRKRRVKGYRRKLYQEDSSTDEEQDTGQPTNHQTDLGITRIDYTDEENLKLSSHNKQGEKGDTSDSDHSSLDSGMPRSALKNRKSQIIDSSDADSGVDGNSEPSNSTTKVPPKNDRACVTQNAEQITDSDLELYAACSDNKREKDGEECKSCSSSASPSVSEDEDIKLNERVKRQRQEKMNKFKEFQKLRKQKWNQSNNQTK